MARETKHTPKTRQQPRLLRIESYNGRKAAHYIAYDDHMEICAHITAPKGALEKPALFVRACNAHKMLITSLQRIANNNAADNKSKEIAVAALAKARGEA